MAYLTLSFNITSTEEYMEDLNNEGFKLPPAKKGFMWINDYIKGLASIQIKQIPISDYKAGYEDSQYSLSRGR